MQTTVTPTLVSLESLLSFLAGKILISTLPVTPSYKKTWHMSDFCIVFLNIILIMMMMLMMMIIFYTCNNYYYYHHICNFISSHSLNSSAIDFQDFIIHTKGILKEFKCQDQEKRKLTGLESLLLSLFILFFLIKKIYFVLQTAKIVILIYYSLM